MFTIPILLVSYLKYEDNLMVSPSSTLYLWGSLKWLIRGRDMLTVAAETDWKTVIEGRDLAKDFI